MYYVDNYNSSSGHLQVEADVLQIVNNNIIKHGCNYIKYVLIEIIIVIH